jgi:hypothetical protein
MAVKSKKRTSVPKDEDGNPDIYVLVNEQGLSILDACEKAGVSPSKGHKLLYDQEVEHNPDLEINPKQNRDKLARLLYKLRKDENARWERLRARLNHELSIADIRELVKEGAEAAGEDGDEFIGKKANARDSDEDDEAEAKTKTKKRTKKAAAKPPPDEEDEDEEDEDEDEDEDEEEEQPTAKRPRTRSRSRK